MKFISGLRRYASKRVEEIESADILAGIPCYNNQETIQHVIQMVTHGRPSLPEPAFRDHDRGRGIHR